MATKQNHREADRSSVTGRYVTEQYAKSHPKTTEHERYKPTPTPAPAKPSKKS